MPTKWIPTLLTLVVLALLSFLSSSSPAIAAEKEDKPHTLIKALIIDGQNNHHWQGTTPILKKSLEGTGLFTVDVATSPPQGHDTSGFKPDFSKYEVVVSNYNGDPWPEPTRKAFEQFVRDGGGFVCVHAADNAFGDWPEYNRMIGIGGWGFRSEKSGPMLRWRDGKAVRDNPPGGGGSHGKYFAFPVTIRDPHHPITEGLPPVWMHSADELYCTLRGPAEDVTILGTATSDVTHEDEPMLMVISYGKGRVFHTTLGHDERSMQCAGFQTTLQRGTEWCATGKVTQKIPDDFPTAEKESKRTDAGKK